MFFLRFLKSSLYIALRWDVWNNSIRYKLALRACIQKFPDWPPGARTANGTVSGHYEQLYRYFVSQLNEFYSQKPLCCFSTSVYCCLFRYRLSLESFEYTLVS